MLVPMLSEGPDGTGLENVKASSTCRAPCFFAVTLSPHIS